MTLSNRHAEDYLVIGLGIAGLLFCEQLIKNGNSFTVIDGSYPSASKVAGGLFNPVVLKRFRAVWKAQEALSAFGAYSRLEKLLEFKCIHSDPIYRRLSSPSERNKWITAADESELEPFLSEQFKPNTHPCLKADFGFGEVLQGGRVEIKDVISAFKDYLMAKSHLAPMDHFDYTQLTVSSEAIIYKGKTYKNLVCAEGMGIANNPFFNQLPIQPNKGEYLKIKTRDLKLEAIYKSDIFLIPLGQDEYLVGATYNRFDQDTTNTIEARKILEDKLKALIACPFEIVGQQAGLRPTVPDRRPIVGTHPNFSRIHLINGLGSRGILHGPMLAEILYNSIEHQKNIPVEMSVERYNALF